MSTLRYAWRSIAKHPLYLTLSTVTLGLGIGVCVSNFATVDALVLRPLLLPEVDRLVIISRESTGRPELGDISPADYYAFADQLTTVERSALLLSAVGMYSVMAFFVTERTHEIGIRMAMGAARGNVVSQVIRQGLKLAAVGLTIGLIGAMFIARALASLLFGVEATDFVSLSGAVLALFSAALLACRIPARRAASVDPMVALRHR